MSIKIQKDNYLLSIKENGYIEEFSNLLTNNETKITGSKWAIKYLVNGNEQICYCDEFSAADTAEPSSIGSSTTLSAANATFHVNLNLSFYPEGFSFNMDIKNLTNENITILDVIMAQGEVSGKMTLPMTTVNLSMGEADFIDEDNFYQNVNAFPVFINRASLCGIEWPVARNVFEDNTLTCTLYLNKQLAPGQCLPSTKSIYFGAAKEDDAPMLFNKRILEVRNRPLHRKSMYFTWLSHAWEGMTVKQADELIDYFIMLYNEYGVHYDVFLFDAGIIESMHTYNQEWSLMRPELIRNMERFAQRLSTIGTQIGIWLGPDDYGRTPESAAKRREALKDMVKKWNVGMIKFDTAVSYPINGEDPYYNNWYMEQLEQTMKELREIRPDLVVVNHRIIDSPYILSILDSTLWSSMETYPDTYLMNYTAPRPYSRMGTFERGMPNYCGSYNPLQEDHGVCFNGRKAGWEGDFMVQAFGRALAVSPESYGTLYCLDDEDYPKLSKMLSLAKEYGDLLSTTDYLNGDFIHSDGNRTLLCLINDQMCAAAKKIKLNEASAANATVLLKTKNGSIDCETMTVSMSPFEVMVLILEGTVADIVLESTDASTMSLLAQTTLSDKDKQICEKIRFEVSSDSQEYQEITSLPASKHPEVTTCRNYFIEKMKSFNVLSENAWDGRADTAWVDTLMYDSYDGQWRLNIGNSSLVSLVEFNLADIWPGPVIDEIANERSLNDEGITISLSNDCINWITADAKAIKEVSIKRHRVTKIVAAFDEPILCKYIKLNARGLVVGSICVRDENSDLITPNGWKGNNKLSNREPNRVFTRELILDKPLEDASYSIYVKLLKHTAPLTQEVAYAWLEPMPSDGDTACEFILPTSTSPAYQFTSWESNSINEGNGWTFNFENLPKGKYVAKLAYIGPHLHPSYELEEGCEEIIVGDFIF